MLISVLLSQLSLRFPYSYQFVGTPLLRVDEKIRLPYKASKLPYKAQSQRRASKSLQKVVLKIAKQNHPDLSLEASTRFDSSDSPSVPLKIWGSSVSTHGSTLAAAQCWHTWFMAIFRDSRSLWRNSEAVSDRASVSNFHIQTYLE